MEDLSMPAPHPADEEMRSLNDDNDVSIEQLDQRVEFSTVRALWDCGCDGNNCGANL